MSVIRGDRNNLALTNDDASENHLLQLFVTDNGKEIVQKAVSKKQSAEEDTKCSCAGNATTETEART